MANRKKVFVGLSGGVDSAVAAHRLLRAGFNVTGVFIKVWHPDFMVCNWEAERLDAMRVAAHLKIPFLTCDAVDRYRDAVAHYFIAEYKAGRTPNPDVMCNKQVKFGAFMEFAQARGVDYIATGHYVLRDDGTGVARLLRGVDVGKDQSYFLWTLSPEQLKYSLFPVGDTTKDKLREEAKQHGLPVFAKKDSQGICFLGHVDIKDFLSHYIDLIVGEVLNEKGEVIGRHEGALLYTLGQRQGFTVNATDSRTVPHYVVARNKDHNTITVAAAPPHLPAHQTALRLTDTVLRSSVAVGDTIMAQTRYRQPPFMAQVQSINLTELTLTPLSITEQPAVGQSCVLYRGDECIGGGIIG